MLDELRDLKSTLEKRDEELAFMSSKHEQEMQVATPTSNSDLTDKAERALN